VDPSANAPLIAPHLADGIVGAVGQTPLVRMRRYATPAAVELWGKLESANPGGSAKDRPAARMIAEALRAGAIGPSTTVIESSSGNMAIGLAQACRFHGLRLICVLDSRTNATTIRMLRAFGADVRIVTEPDPVSGDLLTARLHVVARLAEEIPDSFWPDQYSNQANPDSHAEGTVREIDEALGGELDYLFVAAGTAGTLRGCGEYLREHHRETKLIAVDAYGSALFGGEAGPRKLPGHGAGVESPHSKDLQYTELVRVSDLDCVIGCRRLVEREAIFAGASSGAVAIALERILPSIEPGVRCAIILPDGGAGYLDTVYDDEWVSAELGCTPVELERAVRGELPRAAPPPV
jgi:N-(2-amino-2-carboxyethyl)-L-glutamate synthase